MMWWYWCVCVSRQMEARKIAVAAYLMLLRRLKVRPLLCCELVSMWGVCVGSQRPGHRRQSEHTEFLQWLTSKPVHVTCTSHARHMHVTCRCVMAHVQVMVEVHSGAPSGNAALCLEILGLSNISIYSCVRLVRVIGLRQVLPPCYQQISLKSMS